MKCFYHEAIDSVGVCRKCWRGICRECVDEAGDGLTCKVGCQDEPEIIGTFIMPQERSAEAQSGVFLRIAVGTAFVGGLLLLFGVVADLGVFTACT